MSLLDEFTVNDDSIYCMDVEVNDQFNPQRLSAEEVSRIEACNEEFEKMVIRRTIIHRATTRPCDCNAAAITNRGMKKFAASGAAPIVTQQDIDSYRHGVILMSENGIDKKMLLYVRQCTKCKKIEFFGDIRPMIQMLGQVYCDNLDAILEDDQAKAAAEEASKEEALKNANYIMEDMDTGELIPANSIGEALFGKDDPNLQVQGLTATADEEAEDSPAE